jgi:hypothetical protein
MIPYITNRGGPMVGTEALAMQGLPVDSLLLTRETEDQLADLAGNAMSTTVVGTAILAALMVGKNALPVTRDIESTESDGEDVKMKADDDVAMKDTPSSIEDRIHGGDQLVWKPLDLLPQTAKYSVPELLQAASRSARLCTCEGRSSMTNRSIKECLACNHTACTKCGGRPEHVFGDDDKDTSQRLSPSVFARTLKDILPMSVQFTPVSEDALEELLAKSGKSSSDEKKNWKTWKDAVIRATSDRLNFRDLKRGVEWVATYQSPFAVLELTLHPQPGLPEWRLTAFPLASDPANAQSRKMLADPVARLVCKDTGDLLAGEWRFALPFASSGKVSITGIGEKVPSYEARLGLQGEAFRDKMVFSEIEVSFAEAGAKALGLEVDISGRYTYLEKCGTAMGALHKKVGQIATGDEEDNRPIYFFLDPTRTGEPSKDCFVFSRDKRRLEYRETREKLLELDCSWRQDTPVEAELDGENAEVPEVACKSFWTWVGSKDVQLRVSFQRLVRLPSY